MGPVEFESGRLWERIVQTSCRALQSGVLQPIPTEFEFVEDAGVRFLIRVVANLARKPQCPAPSDSDPAVSRNPFLPYEPQLYVCDAGAGHVCLLNKFNVVDHHLLIVTRDFEHQELPLGSEDFTAWWRCMAEYDSLGFYNGGTIAGASQTHKHLQLVPLPLAENSPRIPLEPLLADAPPRPTLDAAAQLPYRHALVRLNLGSEADVAGPELCNLYRELLALTGLAQTVGTDGRLRGAYNLLFTRQWMLLVPRRRECFASISLNALAFAGALLARDQQQLQLLQAAGPMAALLHVADPRS